MAFLNEIHLCHQRLKLPSYAGVYLISVKWQILTVVKWYVKSNLGQIACVGNVTYLLHGQSSLSNGNKDEKPVIRHRTELFNQPFIRWRTGINPTLLLAGIENGTYPSSDGTSKTNLPASKSQLTNLWLKWIWTLGKDSARVINSSFSNLISKEWVKDGHCQRAPKFWAERNLILVIGYRICATSLIAEIIPPVDLILSRHWLPNACHQVLTHLLSIDRMCCSFVP